MFTKSTYDQLYPDVWGINGPDGKIEQHQKALELLCEKIDELRAENAVLTRRVNDLSIGNRSLGEAIGQWSEPDPRIGNKSKLQLIAERVVGYDGRFAEVHKRLDAWEALQERITKITAQMESLFKGEIK